MPQRTNDFQKLIHDVYKQLSPEGAKVTESAMIPERNNSTEVEVDILIEHEIAGHIFRLAIECRDRGRKADKPWINDLIGKYKDLEVNKIVAVSSSGFSKSAIEKAKANNIETLTLEEALDHQWPSEFVKQGIVLLARNDTLNSLYLVCDPPLPEDNYSSENFHIRLHDTNTTVAFDDFIGDFLFPIVKEKLTEYLRKNMLKIFRVVADLRKAMISEIPVPISDSCIISVNGISYNLKKVIFRLTSSYTISTINMKSYFYNSKKVLIQSGDIGINRTINIIQIAESNKQ